MSPLLILLEYFFIYSSIIYTYTGSDGMKSIPECLASTLHVERPVWISDVTWQPDSHKWKVLNMICVLLTFNPQDLVY